MSAFTLFVLCCAFVQVQSITPFVSSSRSYYNADSTNAESGEDLLTATFHVNFNMPLGQVLGWEDTSVAAVLSGITIFPSFDNEFVAIAVPGSWSMYGFDFTVRGINNVPFPSESSLVIKAQPGFFCRNGTLPGACTLDGMMTNTVGSNAYTVEVGSTFTYGVEWNSQGIDQVSALLTFNHMAFDKSLVLPNLVFTIDGVIAPEFDQVFIAITDTEWLFNVVEAVPSSVICLVPVDASGLVIGDWYGNSIDAQAVRADTSMCYTMPADPLCGDWSEWSETCTFSGCVPIPADEQFNTQTRTRKSADYPNCNIFPEERRCIVDPSFLPCTVQIKSAETGDECANTCDSGGIIPRVGCQCGGNCMEADNCCQSYFPNCIGEEEATTNPIYFYKYAPCWTASTCTQAAPTPPTTFGCNQPDNKDGSGTCASRPYNYRCYCGFSVASGLTCGDVGGNDLCCSGDESFKAACFLE